MSITSLAIKKPIANLMLLLLLLFLGIMSYNKIQTDLLPDITFEFLYIWANLDNTPPRSMVKMVTEPIEEAIKLLPETVTFRSTSRHNDAFVFIQLAPGTNVLGAKNTLEDNISRMNLPPNVRYFVYHFNPQDIPILSVNIDAGGNIEKTRYLVDNIIQPELERISGVGRIDIQGGFEKEIVIQLSQSRLDKHNMSIGEVTAALFAENIQQKGGSIRTGHQETMVKVNSKLESIEDIENIVIRTFPNQKALLIKDLGYVYEDFESKDYIYKFDGKEAFMIDILKKSNANTLEVSAEVKEKFTEFEKRFGIKYTFFNDSSRAINNVLSAIKSDLFKGVLFACLVLLVFLRSLRSIFTIITAVPICIAITFIPMYFTGISINLISLLGFALIAGMLVDNSIIIMENIHRYRILGFAPGEASLLATTEVKRPIFASTLTTIAVFFPIFLIGGFASMIFQDLSFTAIFSLASSYFVAMSIVPMITANFYIDADAKPGFKFVNRFFDSFVFRFIGRFFQWLFVAGNKRIQYRWWTRLLFVVMVGLFLIIGFLLSSIMGGSDEITDQTFLRISIEGAQSTRIEVMEAYMTAIEDFIRKNVPEAKNISALTRKGLGRFFLALYDRKEFAEEYPGKTYRTVDEISRLIHDEFSGIPDITVEARTRSFGHGGMDGGSNILSIIGPDIHTIREISERTIRALGRHDGIFQIVPDYGVIGSEVIIVPDREKLEGIGLTTQDISMIIQRELGSDIATEIFVEGAKQKVRLAVDRQQTQDLKTLREITVNLPGNIRIPINDLIDISIQAEAPNIIRENSQFISRIDFQADRDIPMTQLMRDITNRDRTGIIDDIVLPPGYEFDWGGRMMTFQQSMEDMYVFFIAGLILVFMIMAAEFESLFHPFVIMFTVPVAIFGGVLSLRVLNLNFSENAAMGLIIIIGIVVNDAIIFIDFINQERRRGKDRTESIISAGLIRMRPIFMTTLTTIGAMVPLLFGLEEGSEYKRPMAGIIIGGLSFASFLTLFFIPALYAFFEDIVEIIKFLILRIKVTLRT